MGNEDVDVGATEEQVDWDGFAQRMKKKRQDEEERSELTCEEDAIFEYVCSTREIWVPDTRNSITMPNKQFDNEDVDVGATEEQVDWDGFAQRMKKKRQDEEERSELKCEEYAIFDYVCSTREIWVPD